MSIEICPADWRGLGNRAGPLRNEEMARRGQALILVRYERSRGSRSMLSCARRHQLQIHDHVIPEPPT
jgi:hypothetical protein